MSETRSNSASEPFSALSPECRDVLHKHVLRAAHLSGAMVELGAYRGGSAWLIGRAAPHVTLHVIDTFEGLPDYTPGDEGVDIPHTKFMATSYEQVVEALAPLKNVRVHKMNFPERIDELFGPAARFSLVHIDVDLYEPTLEGLRYFAPRLHPDGVILCHDVNFHRTPGVDRAIAVAMEEMPLAMMVEGGYGVFTRRH
jgi:predicted O-methyltransferase YrrM